MNRFPLVVFCVGVATGSMATAQSPGGRVCDATHYGARGDGTALDTGAIQRAIEACAGAGGGTILLKAGTFLSGTLVLRNNITLRIAPGATLVASPRIADFTPFPPEDVPKIAIDGSTQNKGNGPYHLIHADGAVKLPRGDDHAVHPERFTPRPHMGVDRVDQRAVDVEHHRVEGGRCGRHGTSVPHRAGSMQP